MIIYENKKYAVTQSKRNKHIAIFEKIDDVNAKMIYHASVDEKAPIMTEKEGESYLLGVLKFLEEL